MSMDLIKCYGYGFSSCLSEKLAKLDVKKIVLGLVVLYAILTFFAPDIIGYADDPIGTGAKTGLPWEEPLITLQKSLTGPVAKAVAMIVVVVAGVFVALGEGGPAGRMVGRLVFGLGLLFGALQIISMFMED